MGRLTPSVEGVRLPEPASHPVPNRPATSSEVSHVTVSPALRWHGCPYRVYGGRRCRSSPWRGGRLPRHGESDKLLRQLRSKSTPLVVVYAAGPCGDGLARALRKQGDV